MCLKKRSRDPTHSIHGGDLNRGCCNGGCVHRTSLGQRMRGRDFLFLLPKTPALPPLSKNEAELLSTVGAQETQASARTHVYITYLLSLSSASGQANKPMRDGWERFAIRVPWLKEERQLIL